ncbi:MAG: hypothetical protein J6M21_04455 [Campylobacter sp.]|nr:hypothetical protein [Campylobacter sp.]
MENFENWNKNVRKKNLNNSNGNLNSDKNSNNNSNFNSDKNINSKINPTQSINKNNNQRDYDKEPIVIKDQLFKIKFLSTILIVIVAILGLLFIDIENNRKIFLIFLLAIQQHRMYKNYKRNTKIIFYNRRIEKWQDGKVTCKLNNMDIKKILKTIDSTLPYSEFDLASAKVEKWFFGIYFLILFIFFTMKFIIFAPFFLFVVILILFLPQFIFHKYNEYKFMSNRNINYLYDILFIQAWQGNFLNFLISSNSEYLELRKYFMQLTNINLDEVETQISANCEISEQDLINIKK